MRLHASVVALALFGCAPSEPPRECARAVFGDAPFAIELGSVGGEAVVTAYFPEGRRAGARFAVTRVTPSGTTVTSGTLRADGGSSEFGIVDDGGCGAGLWVHWGGPADGLLGVSRTLVGAPSDDPFFVEAKVTLCPTGASTPAPNFVRFGSWPMAPVGATGNVPVDAATLAEIRGPIPFDAHLHGAGFVVLPRTPPMWTTTVYDTSGVRDLLGRPLGVPTVESRGLSAAVVDLTFAVAPEPGTFLGLAPQVVAGVLRVGSRLPYEFALGLGAPTTTRRVRLRHRFVCTGWSSTGRARLVSEGGRTIALSVGCSEAWIDETHALPTADRWALVLEDTNHAAVPCTFPGTAENPTYELDEVAFD